MMFRLTLKFGLHRVLRTDQRRKSRTPCKLKNVSCATCMFRFIHCVQLDSVLLLTTASDSFFYSNHVKRHCFQDHDVCYRCGENTTEFGTGGLAVCLIKYIKYHAIFQVQCFFV